MEAAVLGEGENVGFNSEGGDGGRDGGREVLRDEGTGGSVLEEKEDERVPKDGLEDDDLDHEGGGKVTVHGAKKRDSHDKGVGKGRQGEEGDGPVKPGWACQPLVEEEDRHHDKFLEGVGGEEVVVHGVWRNCKNCHEPVYAGALLRGEHPPPSDRAERETHSHIKRDDGPEHFIDVLSGDHGNDYRAYGQKGSEREREIRLVFCNFSLVKQDDSVRRLYYTECHIIIRNRKFKIFFINNI
ncbi:hypothetical protein HPP92_020631 [Vanilla planifolia]|uniref:Uncharacterized protein n=1 Tax=Vanilla planifolia TaxID=51239 RepID=A0A835QB41_VANPL|nr:hypothetical protein HPP92_020631 [Vanilla planifolia]